MVQEGTSLVIEVAVGWRLGGILFVVSSPFFACLMDNITFRCIMA